MDFRRRFLCKAFPMNVLIICNKFPYPPTDGGQIATFAMIRGMAEQGHSVTVAAINTAKHYYDVKKMPKHVQSFADFRTLFLNTNLTVWGTLLNLLFSRLPYTATRFISKEFATLLRKIFSPYHFQKILCTFFYRFLYAQ